jgi:dienelactone hydrolase
VTASREIRFSVGDARLEGNLALTEGDRGVVVFAHGTGSGRHSPRNRYVAEVLQDAGMGTLLIDLLTESEERVDLQTGELRFDIGLLAGRVEGARRWLRESEGVSLPLGYFGASTGAAAALVAAAASHDVAAIVSRGGRPDLAGEALGRVDAPTLLIVGGRDAAVIDMNRSALGQMVCQTSFQIVEGATHLFEEPGALEEVAELARAWFLAHLPAGR